MEALNTEQVEEKLSQANSSPNKKDPEKLNFIISTPTHKGFSIPNTFSKTPQQ